MEDFSYSWLAVFKGLRNYKALFFQWNNIDVFLVSAWKHIVGTL